jgi:hypothetical protein
MDYANAEEVAGGLKNKAVLKVGRTPGVAWNRQHVTFNLQSGKSSYDCGVDILSDEKPAGLQYLWHTDTPSAPIRVIPVQAFNAYARGSSSSGRPEIATLHSDTKTLEVWRSPDAAYTIWGYLKKKIVNFSDIPAEYHDVVVDVAIASLDPANALRFATEGLEDARNDSLTPWDGSVVAIERHLGDSDAAIQPDSYNLRGD